MKITLLTIWRVKNYGAELQTYATVRALKQMGHEVTVLDFRLFESKVKPNLIHRILNIFHSSSPANLKFSSFWKKYIPSSRHYKDKDDLKNNLPKSDMFLVGSDQVWNPEITKEKAATYFLDFVPPHIRKASYASSFGTSEWTGSEALTNLVLTQLRQFYGISCRESQGVEILKQRFSLEGELVLDPTLLHKSYDELIGKLRKRKSLAYYQLYPSHSLRCFAKEKAKEMGLEFIDVNKHTYITHKFLFNRKSVPEWIKAIGESAFVITHSFHGVAMAILHHCQFVVIYENGDKVARIQSLLTLLGLEDRLFLSIEEARLSQIWNVKIDYDKVDALLSTYRVRSLEYLRKITAEGTI